MDVFQTVHTFKPSQALDLTHFLKSFLKNRQLWLESFAPMLAESSWLKYSGSCRTALELPDDSLSLAAVPIGQPSLLDIDETKFTVRFFTLYDGNSTLQDASSGYLHDNKGLDSRLMQTFPVLELTTRAMRHLSGENHHDTEDGGSKAGSVSCSVKSLVNKGGLSLQVYIDSKHI